MKNSWVTLEKEKWLLFLGCSAAACTLALFLLEPWVYREYVEGISSGWRRPVGWWVLAVSGILSLGASAQLSIQRRWWRSERRITTVIALLVVWGAMSLLVFSMATFIVETLWWAWCQKGNICGIH